MPTLWRHLREDLVLGNGHLLDQVLRKSGILPRTVHKELGTTLRSKCCWNLQKVDTLFSVQRLHCPGVLSKAKGEENCLYASLQIKTQLIRFVALFFLSTSSVSAEQWQLYAKNLRTIKIERENLRYWWVNQLSLAKSKQKLLCKTKIPWMTKLYDSSTFNKLNRFHQKTEWVNSVRKQDLCVLLKLDNISWQRILVILDNFAQWLVANTLYLEMIQLLNQKGGSKEIWELDLYWKSRPVFSTSNMELKFELSPWIKTVLILGSEFPMERSNMWSIQFKTTQKFLQIHKKSKFHKQARVWLQPGQRQKQNHNRENSLGRHQPYQYMKEDGLTLNHQNKISLRAISRRKSSIFFDTIKRYSEKKMEQLNSTESNSIFEIIIHKCIIGLMIDGKLVWLQEEDRNEDISIALIIREQFSTSVLFKDILEAISLILRYRTMCWLELEYSLTFTALDAHSIFILLSTMDWYLEVKIWAKDKQCSFCLLIQEMKVTETLNVLTSLYHVSRDTCTGHGRGIKTRYFGSILILRSEKN